ncbi:MAG: (d)CMP kinase [Chitinophagaceae bacterium]|nr:(d)CMP kinase [Chitinophagaceae bacterium]
MSGIIIAIDGFSSTGKSTLAKQLAKRLGYVYIDSGAMYRAITLYFIRNNFDWKQDAEVGDALQNIELFFGPEGIYLNGECVEQAIRTLEVSSLVSEISTLEQVRRFAVAQQQKMGLKKGLVMDGRDIGTTVFPQAELKIYLFAQPEIRTQRRFNELSAKNPAIQFDEVLANLQHRDHIDSTREISPLRQAEDAVLLDNSALTLNEQVDIAESWARARIQAL